MPHADLLFILACLFGFFMAWGVGANDVANAMGPSVGSKALTLRQAVIIAAIFEASGALLAGGQVTSTIRKGIIDASFLANTPEILAYGMLAALLAAGLWLLLASIWGWPVSTTHSIVGAIVGFGLAALGPDAIHWTKVAPIVLSWIVTPIMAAVLAYCLFMSIQGCILNRRDPFTAAKRWVPIYTFLVAFIVALVTLTKGLRHLGLNLSTVSAVAWAAATGGLAFLLGVGLLRGLKPQRDPNHAFAHVEKVFGVLMLFIAAAMAFAHGSNDVANAIGPLAAVVSIIKSGSVSQHTPTPLWVLMLGAGGIVLGLTMYGYKVMATIGENITALTPSRGFAAGLATASTVVLASGTGLPVSTTQTLVGAVLGVGMARGIAALNLQVVRTIFLSWVITLPAGAILTILIYDLLHWSFGP